LWAAEQELLDGRPAKADVELAAAAAADPLAADPWRQLASLTFDDWQQNHNPETYERFTQCMTAALRRAPRSAPTWLAAGGRYLKAAARHASPEAMHQALEAYRQAVELYPNDAHCHAELALAYGAAGDHAGLCREARAALDLDQLMPHEEKRLPPELREKLLAAIRAPAGK
jgi:tetratricopeptide (TPR) repeat protein